MEAIKNLIKRFFKKLHDSTFRNCLISVLSVCLGFLIPLTGWNPILVLWLVNLFFGYKENKKNTFKYFYIIAIILLSILIGINLFLKLFTVSAP